MQISKSGQTNDVFMEQLAKLMPKKAETEAKVEETPKETQLEEARKRDGEKAEADAITEKQLPEHGERNNEPVHDLFEKQLEKSREASRSAAPNAVQEGITEGRLNDASMASYPHRNPKAHERTGDKRPINALPEELGSASDEAKRSRYEKANTSGKKRLVDQDIGSQLTDPKPKVKAVAFNLKKTKTASIESCKDYIAYKNATEAPVKTAALDKFAEVKEIDGVLTEILEAAQKDSRPLTYDELAKIAALKDRKSQLLIKG